VAAALRSFLNHPNSVVFYRLEEINFGSVQEAVRFRCLPALGGARSEHFMAAVLCCYGPLPPARFFDKLSPCTWAETS
jgi:hypothetical protein